MGNLDLWKKYEETDTKFIKDYQEGNVELSAINPIYQVKRATEEWGSFGGKWGVKDVNFKTIEIGKTSTVKGEAILLICEYTAILFYPYDGYSSDPEEISEIPIESSKQITFSNNSVDVHYSKKCATDALSKGLSKLGFSADIYMQQYDIDDNKKPVVKSPNELKPYNKDNVSEDVIIQDPIIIDSVEGEAVVIAETVKEIVIEMSQLDKDFMKSMKSQKITKKRQSELLKDISDVLKRAYIKNPKSMDL